MQKIKDKINKSTDINEQLEIINKQISMSKKRIDAKKEV